MIGVIRLRLFLFLITAALLGCNSQPEAQVVVEQPAVVQDSIVSPTFSLSELLGKFDPAVHDGFQVIPNDLASRQNLWLRTEAIEAFAEMKQAADEAGISLRIISATRTFKHQKRIWEAKWNGTRKVEGSDLSRTIPDPAQRARKILEYSSMPGTSRHHWGTDIDINSLDPDYFETGKGRREYEWLRDNAFEFGFCQTYAQKDNERPNGYEEEKWHWTYQPISSSMLKQYQAKVDPSAFGGFSGDTALEFEEVLHYVHGISQECE